ncbi:NAD(P)H-quinone oxidoreductase subunit F [Leptolyngbya sp. BC1307]|uniref:NAD(P)H-quinone oxidoreductase subunit F n=1 Tax=Leptolyngbya sp. BC1307 TaxID=2029589 RepID=UPI000EFC4467|nr:NAD(P)H-quinone oxidoreductase subunit F [Leptolyngbya sp. BC1307]
MINANVIAQTSWLIPCYPLLGAIVSVFWSPALIRRTGPRPVGYINLVTTIFALVHSGLALAEVWHQPAQYLSLSWLQVADLNLTLPLELSALTLGATVVIVILNLLVQVYAVGYLQMDWGWGRMYALLALFEAGMTALVLCDSLFFSYILLEILTLGTYLIVGFWFNQSLVVTGARDAFLTKRVGDLILLMGVLALYPLAGTWNFSELAQWAQANPSIGQTQTLTLALIGTALVAGPVSKCAQFPLHLWLDEAMEGPLPTTILRNSVVVATGAWVLVKLEPVIALSPWATGLAIAIGTVSALGGTMIAAAQIDAKRVLSYLATAYMGLIFIAIGTGHATAALLLVFTHAAATAVLLMSTGSVILSVITQDITQMGGLWSRRPITGLSFLAGIVGLIALPPFGGFWSLMAVLEGLRADGRWGLVLVVLVANGVAGFALVRMFGLMFAGDRTAMTARAPEPIWLMVLPMTVMAGLTLHLPLVIKNLSLFPSDLTLHWSLGWTLFLSSVGGMAIASFFYIFNRVKSPAELLPPVLNRLLAYDFYTPKVYEMTAIAAVDLISQLTDWLDRYVVDGLVNFVGLSSLFSGEALKYANSGRMQAYALTIAFFVAAISIYLALISLPA